MLQKLLKFSLLFLLFFYVGTANVYGQYDESDEEWIDYYYGDNNDYDDNGNLLETELIKTKSYLAWLKHNTSSGGSSKHYLDYTGKLIAVPESDSSRAAIWKDICQNQSASSDMDNYISLIQNRDGCIPSLNTIIEYLATFHKVQNNGNTAFVDNVFYLINRASDEVLEKLIYSFPDHSDIRRLWFNKVYPVSEFNRQLMDINRSTVRRAIGARDAGESQHYNAVHPFDLWLEGKIRTHLLKTYNKVTFDNY